jgi:phosphoribosylamine--glycine ligase
MGMANPGKLKVLILGSGGREHALLKACLKSPKVSEVIVAPGNGGMALEARCLNVDLTKPADILNLVREQGTEFVIVGPEIPLAHGVVDVLEAAGILTYGPLMAGARLEASKAFSKDFLFQHKIPTAAAQTFQKLDAALDYIRMQSLPIVIKASGLAAGKGVVIANTLAEAEQALRDMMQTKIFGSSGDEVVIEEFMQGEEASIMLMVCGEEYLMLPPSQDHKRVGEGDTGLNTGGMGAYAPTTVVTPEVERRLREEIIVPTLKGLKADGIDYRGTLYVGIMVTSTGPRVVEFNVRFGDPECQVLLPLLETDPVEIMLAIAAGTFRSSNAKLRSGSTLIVVLAAGGYPGDIRKGDEIKLPANCPADVHIIHSGTQRLADGRVVTAGGRVLGVVAHAATLSEAAQKAYRVIPTIHFEGMHYRRDIGYRQLKRDAGL